MRHNKLAPASVTRVPMDHDLWNVYVTYLRRLYNFSYILSRDTSDLFFICVRHVLTIYFEFQSYGVLFLSYRSTNIGSNFFGNHLMWGYGLSVDVDCLIPKGRKKLFRVKAQD